MSECSLTDLHRLGPEVPPATYKYGKDRTIDFMLGSPNISDSVRRAGYLAYDDGIFSKHRGLFVDLNFHQLMGPMAAIFPPQSRRLRSEDQPSVDRYVDAFNAYAADHNLRQQVEDLTVVASTLPTTSCQQLFDAIDRDLTRALIHAEKLAKRPSGKFAWSPKLREAGLVASLPYFSVFCTPHTFMYDRHVYQTSISTVFLGILYPSHIHVPTPKN